MSIIFGCVIIITKEPKYSYGAESLQEKSEMGKIKILYVITKLELGGAQKQLLSLIKWLDKEKFSVFLFTAQDGLLLSEALSIEGVTIERSKYLERSINPLKDFFTLIQIYRFIRKNNIEIVHTHSSKAGILGRCAARLAKAKFIVHTVHGWSFNDFQPWLLRKCFILLERLTGSFSNKLIVVSEYDKQKGVSNRIAKGNKYVIIRYGIDYSEFNKRAQGIREELGIDNGDLAVAMIACFKPQKSPQDFIKLAFLTKRYFPNAKFILVGDGVLRKGIERLISKFKLGKEIILIGWRKDVPEVLSAIDVLVLTSLWEGLPVTVLEAMASAKPVISTDTGGVRDVIVEGLTGFLVSPRDVKMMSEKLCCLLGDQSLRRRIGERAKDFLGEKYDIVNTVKETENLYEAL